MIGVKKGFSLLEILLVITIIGVLAGALILVIDPAEQFASARNQQRELDLQTISLAMEQYVEENLGAVPPGLTSTPKNICRSTCTTDTNQVNLQVIVPYIGVGALPVDPDETDETQTGYQVRTTSDGRFNLLAPRAELGQSITMGSSAQSIGFDPKNFPGFAMWFTTSEGIEVTSGNKVSKWIDRSTNKFTFTQSNPEFQPQLISDGETDFLALSFDGEDDFMDGVTYNLNGLSQISLVIVSASTANPDDRDPGVEFQHAYSPFFFSETGGYGEIHITPQRQQVTWRFGTGQGQSFPDYNRPSDVGGSYTSTIVVKDTSNERLYVNGQFATEETGKTFPTANVATQAQLGRENYNSPSYFEGNIVEIMVFESALSDEQIESIQAYFSGKYGAF
jgi:prepilin-type N-terminal cleavage/methylation domain-containing protein